jgi:hypothetical protein
VSLVAKGGHSNIRARRDANRGLWLDPDPVLTAQRNFCLHPNSAPSLDGHVSQVKLDRVEFASAQTATVG